MGADAGLRPLRHPCKPSSANGRCANCCPPTPRALAVATGLGAVSSSCSYAAVALARSLFRKGANFTAAMAFQFASTNLVVELGIILAVLIGWQFTAGEFVAARSGSR